MTETTPQRVWLQFGDATLDNRAIRKWSVSGPFEGGTEYVRADVLAEAVGLLREIDDAGGRYESSIMEGEVITFLANQGETK